MSQDVQMKELTGRQRFKLIKVLANTLQGRIYLAQDKTGVYNWAVVKETWKELVKQGKSRDGHRVPENFEKEKEIQLYLSNLSEQNEGYVRCIDNWEDNNCYYLAIEYCGAGELFDFIRDNHTKGELSQIVKKALSQEQKCQSISNEWSNCVRSIFVQAVHTVSWMHSHGIAHLDLSLENTMLALVEQNSVKIKIIDFGLARYFKPNQRFNERVGKVGYMAPEVYAKQDYLPEKADIWCLGVMLFMMLVGAPPYEVPNPTNPAFRFIMAGRLRDVLAHWKRLPLVSTAALDVMEKIFKAEKERINMEELRRHPYVDLPNVVEKKPDENEARTALQSNDEIMSDRSKSKTHHEKNNYNKPDEKHVTASMKTQKAQEFMRAYEIMSKKPENVRKWVAKIQEGIQELEHPSNISSSTNSNDNHKIQEVTENKHHNDLCISELRQLLLLAENTLDHINAT